MLCLVFFLFLGCTNRVSKAETFNIETAKELITLDGVKNFSIWCNPNTPYYSVRGEFKTKCGITEIESEVEDNLQDAINDFLEKYKCLEDQII
jgi:hypothetical protein